MTMVNNRESAVSAAAQYIPGKSPIPHSEKERDHETLLDFMRLVFLIKQAKQGVPILQTSSDGLPVPEHIALFTTEASNPYAEAEEARRTVFEGKIGALAIIEPCDTVIDTVLSSDGTPIAKVRAVGQFSEHLLVETTYFLKNSDSIVGYAYDIHPAAVASEEPLP